MVGVRGLAACVFVRPSAASRRGPARAPRRGTVARDWRTRRGVHTLPAGKLRVNRSDQAPNSARRLTAVGKAPRIAAKREGGEVRLVLAGPEQVDAGWPAEHLLTQTHNAAGLVERARVAR